MGKTYKDQQRVDRFNEVVAHAQARGHKHDHDEPTTEYVEAPQAPEWELAEVRP